MKSILLLLIMFLFVTISNNAKDCIIEKPEMNKKSHLKNSLQEKNTWAERLGFSQGKKVLLLHCDDGGMCPEANSAIKRYIENNQVLSASVMMPCPNAESAIMWAKSHSKADIGVHLTLTSEWNNYRWGPLMPPEKVPGLIDPDGKLWHQVSDVVKHASAKEVETEIRAQIEKVLTLGLKPTHIDTHMGTLYASPEYFRVFLKVAEEYNIPANAIDMSVQSVADLYREQGYPINEEMIELLSEYRLPKIDNLISLPVGSSYEQVREKFFREVKALKPGITEIVFHPSLNSENLKTITDSWQQRVWEGELFADPQVHQFFEDEEIVITDWKDIMKRFNKKK